MGRGFGSRGPPNTMVYAIAFVAIDFVYQTLLTSVSFVLAAWVGYLQCYARTAGVPQRDERTLRRCVTACAVLNLVARCANLVGAIVIRHTTTNFWAVMTWRACTLIVLDTSARSFILLLTVFSSMGFGADHARLGRRGKACGAALVAALVHASAWQVALEVMIYRCSDNWYEHWDDDECAIAKRARVIYGQELVKFVVVEVGLVCAIVAVWLTKRQVTAGDDDDKTKLSKLERFSGLQRLVTVLAVVWPPFVIASLVLRASTIIMTVGLPEIVLVLALAKYAYTTLCCRRCRRFVPDDGIQLAVVNVAPQSISFTFNVLHPSGRVLDSQAPVERSASDEPPSQEALPDDRDHVLVRAGASDAASELATEHREDDAREEGTIEGPIEGYSGVRTLPRRLLTVHENNGEMIVEEAEHADDVPPDVEALSPSSGIHDDRSPEDDAA